MTDAEKKMNKYTNSIERKLNLPFDLKARVMTDFISSISARREAGQTDDEIYAELGTPAKIAADLNEQMKEFTYRKSPWRWACLVLAVLSAITIVFHGIAGIITAYLNHTAVSVGVIGGADGPTAIFITTSPDALYYQIGISLLLLIMGFIGFFSLSHCKRKI